ncbi:MAG: DUF4974 domain-containing protein [Maribacter sp.]
MQEKKPTKSELQAFFRGECPKEDFERIKLFLDNSASDKMLEKLWESEDVDNEFSLSDSNKEALYGQLKDKINSKKPFTLISNTWFVVAASLLLLIGLFFVYNTPENNILQYTSNSREVKFITLPDSSLIVLNANSSFDYSETDEQRLLHLKGEAFFKVFRDENLPFIINAKSTEIEVLGTSFNVSTYEDRFDIVTVETGKVKVSDTQGSVFLTENEEAVYLNEKLQKRSALSGRTSWIQKKRNYVKTPLRTIFDDMETWYAVEITSPERIDTTRYTATISLEKDLDDFLENLKISENIDFTILGDTISVHKD